jgi:hypothetical protein
MMPY